MIIDLNVASDQSLCTRTMTYGICDVMSSRELELHGVLSALPTVMVCNHMCSHECVVPPIIIIIYYNCKTHMNEYVTIEAYNYD